ncbi:hypothetical protein I5U86_00080 [Stenotrophomonas maltophilia]|nr:hypothetical protein [Stenotrophomonas maltophilia]MBH1688848.1 hypothetical protein [Stenotrophomonas maltophilia]MBH1706293.1 hypothetical protein [Stenotrophomonas maltophilia]MBH1846951.1 hypothetical protein [Stenotrophomonas maltophilia]UXB25625.1 hypothetical protein K7567_07675 [Stenotrophomonas maltophilia]
MKLKIHSVEGKGEIDKECIWIDVLEPTPDVNHYILCDTTFTAENTVSNELRHMFWLPNLNVKKGDWIKVMTKAGIPASASNNRQTTTHIVYWNLGKTVWNKAGDAAILFHVDDWRTHRA